MGVINEGDPIEDEGKGGDKDELALAEGPEGHESREIVQEEKGTSISAYPAF